MVFSQKREPNQVIETFSRCLSGSLSANLESIGKFKDFMQKKFPKNYSKTVLMLRMVGGMHVSILMHDVIDLQATDVQY